MPAPPPPTRLTDSPWFWVYVFGGSALAGLVLIGPKFSQRQAKLESKQAGRESAWKQRVAGEAESHDSLADAPAIPAQRLDSSPPSPKVPLWPLAALLAAVMVIAWAVLWRRRAAKVMS